MPWQRHQPTPDIDVIGQGRGRRHDAVDTGKAREQCAQGGGGCEGDGGGAARLEDDGVAAELDHIAKSLLGPDEDMLALKAAAGPARCGGGRGGAVHAVVAVGVGEAPFPVRPRRTQIALPRQQAG